MSETQIIPPPPKIVYVKCHRCKLIHVHGWAHYCPKAPDLTIKHPDLPVPSPVRSFRVPREMKKDQGQLHLGKTEKALPSVANQQQEPRTWR